MAEAVGLGVLVSGGGTTLQNFIDRIEDGTLYARIACVVSTSPKAYALERAARHGIPAESVVRSEYGSVEEFSDAIFAILDSHKTELVALAGFLKLIRIPERYNGKVMNIHPALIPSFCGDGMYGMKVHTAVVERGVKLSGCTVHFADNVYDSGPIIIQKCIPVYDTDSPEDVQKRVFEKEKEAYPEAINLFASRRLKIDGKRVLILPG